MDITANNIANANTPGYRTERVQFSDWIDPQPSAATVPGSGTVTYTQDRAVLGVGDGAGAGTVAAEGCGSIRSLNWTRSVR